MLKDNLLHLNFMVLDIEAKEEIVKKLYELK
jgi:hypothetical protein